MSNLKKSIAALAIGSAMLMPMTSFAAFKDFGDITSSTSETGYYSSAVILGSVFDGSDTFNFSLNAPKQSDISIDLFQIFGLNIGNTHFTLTNTTTSVEVGQIPISALVIGETKSFSFSNLANGNYTLSFIPSNILALNFGGQVTISATAVPEPETNALMLVGLGLIGFIARRKFA